MEDSNKKQRNEFVKYWANYVKTHPDKEWSKQQNVLINFMLRSARQKTREEYLNFKNRILE